MNKREWRDEVQTQQQHWKEKFEQILRCDAPKQVTHPATRTGLEAVTLLFFGHLRGIPKLQVSGALWCFLHNPRIQRNKRPQEDYRKDSTLAPPSSCVLGWVLSPISTSLSFSCVLQRELPALAVTAPRLSWPSHQRKTRQTFGFQAADRRGGGEDRQWTWHHFVRLLRAMVQPHPTGSWHPAQPMSRSSFHARI